MYFDKTRVLITIIIDFYTPFPLISMGRVRAGVLQNCCKLYLHLQDPATASDISCNILESCMRIELLLLL